MISLFTILRGSPESADILRAVTILQDGIGAELLVAHPDANAALPVVMGYPDGVVSPIDPATLEIAAKEARQAFEAVCGGKPTCRFKETRASVFHTLRKQSLFMDLAVVARDPGLIGDDLSLLKATLVSAGAPSVLLPNQPLKGPPQTVVMAWNGQAAAARAIRASMPFAKKAKRVVVLEYAGTEVNRSRLDRYFHRQGVTPADWRKYGDRTLTARGRARALLAEATLQGCDMLVMGAYGDIGESVFRFGRATDKVAQAAKIPVLFSH